MSLGLSIDLDLLSGLGAILGLWKFMSVWTLCPTVFWIVPCPHVWLGGDGYRPI